MNILNRIIRNTFILVTICVFSMLLQNIIVAADDITGLEPINGGAGDMENVDNSFSAIFYKDEERLSSSDNVFYANSDVTARIQKNKVSDEEKNILDKITGSLKEEYKDDSITFYADIYVGIGRYEKNQFSEYKEVLGDSITISSNSLGGADRQVFQFKKISSYKFYRSIDDDDSAEGDENDEVVKLVDIISYSPVYQVVYDKKVPVISIKSEEETDLDETEDRIETIYITDEIGIKSVAFYRNSNLIEEINLEGDKRIVKYEYDAALIKDSDGDDVIRTVAVDLGGNIAEHEFTYHVDDSSPIISCVGIENGAVYADNASLKIHAQDNEAEVHVFYKVDYTDLVSNTRCIESVTKDYDGIGEIIREYKDEGIYDVSMFAYDSNGNYSKTLKYSFGIDSKAPVVSIDNVNNGGVYKESVSASARVNELFYENVNVEWNGIINDKSGSRRIDMSPYDVKARSNKNIVMFSNEGEYNLSLKATDALGHSSYATCDFLIDKSAPEVYITVNGKDVQNSPDPGVSEVLRNIPDIKINTSDSYTEYSVVSSIYKKEKNGSFKLDEISNYMSVGKKISFESRVPGEGEYVIKVAVKDEAGNTNEKVVSVLVDENPPVIGYVSDFNEKYLKSFLLPKDLSSYIQDATNVRYKAYLNSKEIKSCDIKKDGKYLLQVVAEDEAGNRSEKITAFIVDNTKPRVIVGGLDEDGKVVRDGIISLTLFDNEDFFKEAFVNGKHIDIEDSGKEILIKATDYGDYDISVVASDYAGNEITQVVKTTCAFSANPFTIKINSDDIKTLTKNDEEIHETFFQNAKGMKFYVFCGCLFILAAIFLGVALFDIVRL